MPLLVWARSAIMLAQSKNKTDERSMIARTASPLWTRTGAIAQVKRD